MRQIGDMGSWHMEFMDWQDVIRIQLTFFLGLQTGTDGIQMEFQRFFFSEVHPLSRGHLANKEMAAFCPTHPDAIEVTGMKGFIQPSLTIVQAGNFPELEFHPNNLACFTQKLLQELRISLYFMGLQC
jgi:hypothetical protein